VAALAVVVLERIVRCLQLLLFRALRQEEVAISVGSDVELELNVHAVDCIAEMHRTHISHAEKGPDHAATMVAEEVAAQPATLYVKPIQRPLA
jgi:hypothetical protein